MERLRKAVSFVVGLACAHCGTQIQQGGLFQGCPDCAAIFCESCVRDGTFSNHYCEDYNYPDPAEYDFED